MTRLDEKLTRVATGRVPPGALLRPLPSGGLKAVLALMEDRGLPVQRALERAGVPRSRLEDPDGRITVAEELALLRQLVPLTGDPWFGLSAGRCYRLNLFGALGAAVQAADTARQAFRFFLRYLRLSYTHFHVFLEPGEDNTTLVMQSTFELGGLYRYYLLRDMAFTLNACQELAPELTRRGLVEISLSLPEPEDAAPVREFFGCPVSFNSTRSTTVMRNDVLDEPLPMSNEHVRSVLEQQCRRDLDSLDGSDQLADRIRQLLRADPSMAPDEGHLADLLSMTPRTLRRHLAAAGTCFQSLRNEVRCEKARELLCGTDMPVSHIAEELGYSEAAPFVRAFRRWTGTTPRRYRVQPEHRAD